MLKWRYTDTVQFYETIITQVVENYIRGKVPIDVDILEIDSTGYLPVENFREPLNLGEKYYNRVVHNSHWKIVPFWTYFIEIDNREEKIKLNLEFLSMYLEIIFLSIYGNIEWYLKEIVLFFLIS